MNRPIAVAALALALAAAPPARADLVLPGTWDVGTIGDTATVSRSVTVQNTGRAALAIRLSLPAAA